jgi:hypothetical protein
MGALLKAARDALAWIVVLAAPQPPGAEPAREHELGLARCTSGGIVGRQCGEYRADTGLCGLPAKLGACAHREGGAA